MKAVTQPSLLTLLSQMAQTVIMSIPSTMWLLNRHSFHGRLNNKTVVIKIKVHSAQNTERQPVNLAETLQTTPIYKEK